ncbi:Flp pilus assembly protein CpaB [Raoultibacter phocaeensis]|uniref:Flp pilus assembly protein CpaB n=1 Tax=Raoultibacter phocaeensis TaxID=2479841 RepID=UPI00111BA983|nr:Flp pilus assembly protein CpaB [Raoultibacter phocaeensis]
MKKPATVIMGIVCGIVCAAAVFIYLQAVRHEADEARAEALSRYGGEQVEVCVATRDIAVGEKVDATNTTVRLWLADLLPADAVRSVRDVSGEQLGSPVYEGEVVTSKRFEHADRAIDAPAGLSVLSIPVKDVQALGGSVSPGLRVDVYSTGASGTELLATDVPVVSSSNEGEGAISWVALAVDPQSVQELIAASQKTELYLVMPGDKQEGGTA